MPKKYSAADYDDDYGDDDYDYEDEEGEEEYGDEYGAQGPEPEAGSESAPASTAHSKGTQGLALGNGTPQAAPPPSVSGDKTKDSTAGVALERCPICTFDNPRAYLACEVCGTERGRDVSPSAAPSTGGEAEAFEFDTPSPDDVVVASRSGAVNRVPAGFQPRPRAPPPANPEPGPDLQSGPTPGSEPETGPGSTSGSTSAQLPPKKKKGREGQARAAEEEEEDSDRPETSGRAAMEVTGSGKKNSTGEGAKQRQRPSLPLASYVPEPWMGEKASEEEKGLLHLIVVGHVDAGKSTLMGHLLHRVGQVSQKEMHKHEKEAKEKGKGSFAFAWVLDEGAEERARGVTMSVAMAHFETRRLKVVLLDAPGHRDFVPSMIAGASQADAAILAVDAAPGAFESGMEGERGSGGQTREHAQLVRSLGVEQLIVAVNKMDAVGYDRAVFERIKKELGPFLKHCGFREGKVQWLPISGLEGQNLTEAPTEDKLKAWYTGPTLMEAVDSLSPPGRLIQRPLRLVLAETLRGSRTLGQSAGSGKLEGGAIRPGSKVLVQPIGEVATVKAIERDSKSLPYVTAGESVDVGLVGVDPAALVPGGVLSHPDYPVPVVTRFEARILTLGITVPILKGTQVDLHAHSAREPAHIAQLSALLDPKTGAVAKQRVRALGANQSALVEIVPERGVCLEEYANYRALGRVALRGSGRTLAVGIVTRIISQQ